MVNNEFIDLDEATIRLERINPFFVTEVYQGDYSFPFTVPATDKNLRIFGFINYLAVGARNIHFDAYLRLYGAPRSKTKLIVTKGRKGSLSIILTSGIKSMKCAELKLADLPLGKDIHMGETTQDVVNFASGASRQENWWVLGVTFVPFKQADFYEGKNNDFNGVVNQMNSTNGDVLCENSAINGNPHCLVPFLFLFYVLNQIFKYEGLYPSGSFWLHNEYNKLLLYNNYSLDGGIDRGSTKAMLYSITNNNFQVTNSRVLFLTGHQGAYDNTGYWYNSGAPGSFYVINKIGTHYINVELQGKVGGSNTPGEASDQFPTFHLELNFIPVATLTFDNFPMTPTIQTKFLSYEFVATPADIGKPLTLVYFWGPDAAAVPHVSLQPGSYITIDVDYATNSLTNTLQYKNHVADMTVSEFLAEVKKLGVMFDFDYQNSGVKLDAVNDLVDSSTIHNWSEKVTPDYEISFEDSGKGIVMSYEFPEQENTNLTLPVDQFKGNVKFLPAPAKVDDWAIAIDTNEIHVVGKNTLTQKNEWQVKGYNYRPYRIGKGETELTCKLAPMQMCIATNAKGTPDENAALMPLAFGKGSSPMFGIGITPTPFRLVFYRGRNRLPDLANKGGIYILASTGLYGINGNQVGNTSFHLDNQTGILRKTGERLYKSINASEVVEKDIYLNAVDVLTLKSFIKVSFDYNLFLLKSISITISKKITKATAYFLKL